MATKTAKTTVKRLSAPVETEESFQAAVIDLARHAGWLVWHAYDSRRSSPGFPDLTLVNPPAGRVIFAELKTQRGRVRPEQRTWLWALEKCPSVEVALWRPSQWDEIVAALLHGAPIPAYTERPELVSTVKPLRRRNAIGNRSR